MDETQSAAPVIETLATGDEVVAGDVADTNGAFVAHQLTRRGLLVARHTALPDDCSALRDGLARISTRADLCICSGGLGPTEDDLTADVVAAVAGVPVIVDPIALERMQLRFRAAGYRFSENNRRSARVPAGATVYQNEVGTAPAFALAIGRCQLFCLPGVPTEHRHFVHNAVLPWCASRWGSGFGAVIQLKTLGWGESHLAERFSDYAVRFPEVKVGYRAHSPEVWLKLTASAANGEIARQLLQPAVEEAERRLAGTVFGRDDQTLDGIVHALLIERGQTLAIAESCTGGRIAAQLTHHAGASHYLLGGAVAYANSLKQSLLGVDPLLIEAQGAVSRKVAEAMAIGVRERTGAALALATTGIAGPGGGSQEKPVGLTYLALAHDDGDGTAVVSLQRTFRGDRDRIQRAATLTALELLRRHLLELAPLEDGRG